MERYQIATGLNLIHTHGERERSVNVSSFARPQINFSEAHKEEKRPSVIFFGFFFLRTPGTIACVRATVRSFTRPSPADQRTSAALSLKKTLLMLGRLEIVFLHLSCPPALF